ncbi:MAG: hypothetical protein ACI353_02535 [Alloprevotella sp.]
MKTFAPIILLCCLLFPACVDDVEYLSTSHTTLAFSVDTIAFDTVITGQPTNTMTFQVYNQADQAVRLTKVFFETGAQSVFKANVDGTFLEQGTAGGFEIGAGDSLRVFLFANVPPVGSEFPKSCRDALVFEQEGGARAAVELTASGQDVEILRATTVDDYLLLTEGRPWQIFDSLVVAPGAILEIEAGARLYFHADANLIVRGTLIAEGTAEKNIVFRGDRLGNMFNNQPYDRIPGQWGGIVLAGESYDNVLNFCDIHSGTFGIRCDSSDVALPKLQLENSVLHNVSGNALEVRMSQLFVGNSQITNAGLNCLHIRGGYGTFVHCTIGRFYDFQGDGGVALDFSNYDDGAELPLSQLAFANCIITGYSTDEIMGTAHKEKPDLAFNYGFINCLLNTPADTTMAVTGCIWDCDDNEVYREDNFLPGFDLKQLLYRFELAPASKAVGTADFDITTAFYPLDRLGRERTSDGKSDMGCYEMQPQADTENGAAD